MNKHVLICPEDNNPCTCAEEPVGTLHRTGDPVEGCPRERRCTEMKGGLLRCWDKVGHPGEHRFKPPTRAEALTVRPVQLALTPRLARSVLVLARRERARKERDFKKSDFKPAPGKYDANLAAMAMMDDIIKQLEPHVPEVTRA